MQYDEFIGQVQHRARMSSRREAERAVEATLQTLAERLVGGAAGNLAAQLPPDLGRLLTEAESTGREFGLREFFELVAEREGVDPPKAAYHARCVIDVLKDATQGVLDKVRAQLPDEWDPLFEAGSEGEMRLEG
jgi:uncharacterized protein (DUF2267 family)